MPKKILFLNNQGLASYGGGVSILRHLSADLARDWSVTVLSFDAPAASAPRGVRQLRLQSYPTLDGPWWRIAPILRARHLARVLPQDIVRESDMVVCFDPHFASALRGISRRKLAYLSLSCVPRQERAAGGDLLRFGQYVWLERMIARAAGRVIVASHAHARELRRWEVLYDVVPAIMHPLLPGPEQWVDRTQRTAPMVLSAGRLVPGKGFTHFVELAGAMRDVPCRFVLAGDGPDRPRLEARAKALGLGERLVFAGAVSDLTPLLREADLLMHPSPYESFGMVIFEAMRAGVVPVGRCGPGVVVGYAEILIDGVDGCLLNLDNFPASCARLRTMLADAGVRERMADAARSNAQRLLEHQNYALRFRALLDIGAAHPRIEQAGARS